MQDGTNTIGNSVVGSGKLVSISNFVTSSAGAAVLGELVGGHWEANSEAGSFLGGSCT